MEAGMGEACRKHVTLQILVRNLEGKRIIEIYRCKCYEINVRRCKTEDVNWIRLSQNLNQQKAAVNMVMDLGLH
jgi:hypothetical protein